MPPDKPLTNKDFRDVYSKVPRLCVDVLIENKTGVLLTFRNIEPADIWHIPGGTLFLNETIEQAVGRIAKNELGVEVKIIKQIGLIDFFPYAGLGHPVSVVHKVEIISGKIKLNNEATEFGYFRIPPKNTVPQHRQFLAEYFKYTPLR